MKRKGMAIRPGGERLMYKRTGILAALMISMLVSTHASASFVVSPMEIHLEAGPGERGNHPVAIKNTGTNPLTVKLYMMDSRFFSDGREEDLKPGAMLRSCASWIDQREQVLDIKPGEVKKFPLLLEIPPDADGSYWTKLYVEEISTPEPSPQKKGNRVYQVFMKQRVGVRIFEDVTGTLRPDARITRVSVPLPVDTGVEAVRSSSIFRLQMLATRDDGKAKSFAGKVRDAVEQPVYVQFNDPYYKVQVGDYKTREEAAVYPDRVKAAGFARPWVVEVAVGAEETIPEPTRKEEVPVESAAAAIVTAEPKMVDGYRVQIFASSKREKAAEVAAKMEADLGEKAYVEEAAGAYKTRVGNCVSRDRAIELMMKLRRVGYETAWITAALVESPITTVSSVPPEETLPVSSVEPETDASPDPALLASVSRREWTPAVHVSVKNTGNCLLHCTGKVEIRDSGGAAVDTLWLGTEGKFTLFPDVERELDVTAEAFLIPGTYTALAIVDFGGEYLVAGDTVFDVPEEAVIARSK